MEEPKMSALYYELLRQVESMTAADLAINADTRISTASLRTRARLVSNRPNLDTSEVFGEILYVRDGFIHGWALNGSDPAERVVVQAIADGKVISRSLANEAIPPLLSSSMRQGAQANAGFVLRGFAPGRKKLHRVDIVAGAQDTPLAKGLQIYSPSTPLKRTPYMGFAESNNEGIATGWACCSEDPTRNLEIIVLINGLAVARARAHEFRGDLSDAGIGSGEHGFSVKLNPRLLIEERRSIEFIIAENGLRLDGSPLEICGQIISGRPAFSVRRRSAYIKVQAGTRRRLASIARSIKNAGGVLNQVQRAVAGWRSNPGHSRLAKKREPEAKVATPQLAAEKIVTPTTVTQPKPQTARPIGPAPKKATSNRPPAQKSKQNRPNSKKSKRKKKRR